MSRRRTFQTINLRSVATPASVHATDPLHSANSKTIRQSSTDPFPIQDQSVNQKPILYQSANPPPTHQDDANLPIQCQSNNPWQIQSVENLPIHHQSVYPTSILYQSMRANPSPICQSVAPGTYTQSPNGPSAHLSAPIIRTGLSPIGRTLARIDRDHANPVPIGGQSRSGTGNKNTIGDRPKCLDGGRFRRSIYDQTPLQRQSTLPTHYILPIPKQSGNPRPIHFQSKTNLSIECQSYANPWRNLHNKIWILPILDQSCNLMPILDQFTNSMPIQGKSHRQDIGTHWHRSCQSHRPIRKTIP